jgi:NAD(P)-dependent dehydrogenase (short-subunit alcohol dehydrogenase family)
MKWRHGLGTRRAATKQRGRRAVAFEAHIADAAFCASLISQTLSALGRLDILVSNAAHQNRKESIEDIWIGRDRHRIGNGQPEELAPAYVFLASDADSACPPRIVPSSPRRVFRSR